MRLFLQILLVLSTTLTAAACSTDDDCNLNGVCTNSACVCDPGWISADCGALDLRPASFNTGYNATAAGTSSWCSHIVQDPNNEKLFHMFASEFVNKCGLTYWVPYSRVIRAESTNGPAGPYTFAAEVAPSFAHNPTVTYSPAAKLYLLYHIGCPQTISPGCNSKIQFACGSGNNKVGESGVTLRTSPDLLNWTSLGIVLNGDSAGTWDADVTNPTAMALYTDTDQTSEILLAYRGCPNPCAHSKELIGMPTTPAPDYKGPYNHGAKPVLSDANEDPFIWRDARGNFHLLLHSQHNEQFNTGRHAFARSWNGLWTYSSTTAYTTTVKFTNGETIVYNRRERPQLYFSTDGQMTPLYLMNGVQATGSTQSYSLVVPIGSGAAAYEKSLGF